MSNRSRARLRPLEMRLGSFERRIQPRLRVTLDCGTFADPRRPVLARLADISASGCQVELAGDDFLPNQLVTLTIHTAVVEGFVRWRRNGAIGVEFLAPLSPSHLATLPLAYE
jgi:hypothetical protein